MPNLEIYFSALGSVKRIRRRLFIKLNFATVICKVFLMFGANHKSDSFKVGSTIETNLKSDFEKLFEKYSGNKGLIDEICELIFVKYAEKHRAYHNLSHVNALLFQAEDLREKIKDWESFYLAIWFHDVIYQPKGAKNEIESAQLAVDKLGKLNVPRETIEKVEAMILATQKHQAANLDDDGKLFLDLDLSILGRDAETYRHYSKAIRREYSFVPWFLYRRSRRKILENFLSRDYLYFTRQMRERFELLARANISFEVKELS